MTSGLNLVIFGTLNSTRAPLCFPPSTKLDAACDGAFLSSMFLGFGDFRDVDSAEGSESLLEMKASVLHPHTAGTTADP